MEDEQRKLTKEIIDLSEELDAISKALSGLLRGKISSIPSSSHWANEYASGNDEYDTLKDRINRTVRAQGAIVEGVIEDLGEATASLDLLSRAVSEAEPLEQELSFQLNFVVPIRAAGSPLDLPPQALVREVVEYLRNCGAVDLFVTDGESGDTMDLGQMSVSPS